jgi:hypothetical protein
VAVAMDVAGLAVSEVDAVLSLLAKLINKKHEKK